MSSRLISDTASELLPRNNYRKSLIVQNEDAAIQIYLKRERVETPSVSSTDHDHRIGPGNAVALNFGTDGVEAVQDRWTIIAASGTPRVSFFETEDIKR